MQGRLLMMPSSSQVLDHQLIFHIMYGLGQFHHRQNKGEERGDLAKKSNSCLTNIERKRCKNKQLLLPKHRGQEKQPKKQLAAATWLEDPCRSKSGNLDSQLVVVGEQLAASRVASSQLVPVVVSKSIGKRAEQQPTLEQYRVVVEQQQDSSIEVAVNSVVKSSSQCVPGNKAINKNNVIEYKHQQYHVDNVIGNKANLLTV